MAELTFDWLKPPEKKKKKKKKRRRKKKGADSSASKSPTRRGSYGGRSVSASRSPSRSGRPTPGADRHKQLMKSNMRASKKAHNHQVEEGAGKGEAGEVHRLYLDQRVVA